MREIWLVCRREFLERVMTRSFVIGTISFPLLIGLMMFLPSMLDRGELRTIAVIDETDIGVGQALADRLTREPADESANRYEVEVLRGRADALQSQLITRVEADQIDGFLIVPADVFSSNEIRYRSTTIGSPGMFGDIQRAASETIRGERLRLAGIDMATVAEVVRPVSVQSVRIGSAGEERGGVESTLIIAYLLAFVIYFMVFFYGVHVMRSVLEEKTSRIAEVLVSSMRSDHLMAGKIFGVAGAAIVQVLAWAALIALMVTQSAAIAERMNIDPEMLANISLAPGTLLLLLAFFLLGFFQFAAIFAALGAAVNSEQEAQAFQMVLVVPLFIPLLFLVPLTAEPLGRLATVLGLFPLTSPVAMPMRLSAADIPPLQVAAGLALLVLGLAVTAWVAGKIYRIGILATGKRPSVKELGRWLRMT